MQLQAIGKLEVSPFNAVQNYVHGTDEVGERLELDAIESAMLESLDLLTAQDSSSEEGAAASGVRLEVTGALSPAGMSV